MSKEKKILFGNLAFRIILCLTILLTSLTVSGQDEADYVKTNAIRIDDPEKLNKNIYFQLLPFQIIMFGEMHGTNESAPFVNGLADLFTSNGDSVQIGLEISSSFMTQFISQHSDSSIYQSTFFKNPPYLDGRESFAWASLISKLNRNPKVQIFFFDVSPGEGKIYLRDSLMYLKIKTKFLEHPSWKMVTLSGNFHTRISGEPTMALYLKEDKQLNLSSKICSLNMEYIKGTCRAAFSGIGLQKKELGSYPSVYNTSLDYDSYFLLVSPKSNYDYNGIYFTKYITAATMVCDSNNKIDTAAIKKQLSEILDRDQKTRSKGDSSQYMQQIDSSNLVKIESLITKFGWPGKSFVGASGNNTIFLVVQHADIKTQEKYLPMLVKSVDDSESRPCDLALLEDRVLMREGKKQLYGSQVTKNKMTGAEEFYPIEDEKNVNIRRQKMGLQTIEEYAKYFGIEYKFKDE